MRLILATEGATFEAVDSIARQDSRIAVRPAPYDLRNIPDAWGDYFSRFDLVVLVLDDRGVVDADGYTIPQTIAAKVCASLAAVLGGTACDYRSRVRLQAFPSFDPAHAHHRRGELDAIISPYLAEREKV